MNRGFLVSIIIPNYNRMFELLRAIESIFLQTYTNCEIIIVDDCSDIDPLLFLKDNLNKDELLKIKIFYNNTNIGPSASRNKGVEKSNGEYIAFLDSDDYWLKTKLEKQMAKFIKDEQLNLVYTDQYREVNGQRFPSNKTLIKDNLLDCLLNGWTAPNPSTLMIKKIFFNQLNGFDSYLRSCEDHDLWFRMSLGRYKIDYVNEPLSCFLQDSTDRISFDITHRMDGVYKFLEKCRNYIPSRNYQEFYNKYIFDTSFPILIAATKDGDFLNVIKIYFKYLIFNRFFYKRILIKIMAPQQFGVKKEAIH
jgi:glycosyltransferase involved in cell wall biosynthesis